MKNKNIISLIGMTGSGKTTVGKILAEKLNCDFLDLDEIITKKTGQTPSEIFALHGEEYFRQTETSILASIFDGHDDKSNNLILSCGGGIVLKEKNRELLKNKSFVVWLVRPVEEVLKNHEVLKRPPINNDPDNYIKIFARREKLYAGTCENNGLKIEYTDISKAIENILNIIK